MLHFHEGLVGFILFNLSIDKDEIRKIYDMHGCGCYGSRLRGFATGKVR